MQPLIDKYGINPETNKLFIKVCEMFDGKPNYQIWGVKLIFSQTVTFETLSTIHDWLMENGNLISSLEKKNIVSYSTKSSIAHLFNEIEGLERLSLVKDIISHFNTEQKKMLTEHILNNKNYTPIEAYKNATIKKWYDVFKIFNKKPMGIKNKFYSTCSALKNPSVLLQAILDTLEASYNWKEGKADLLSFIEYNTKDCEVVFNEGSCVIVRVPSFASSHKLCGSGRTGWCLAREESYFRSYVTSHSNRDQYFLFDFSRKETDAFAHIGFTVEKGNGIVEAQTGHNYGMLSPFTQNGESLSIYNVLDKFGIKMNTFMRLPSDLGFKWDLTYFLEMVKAEPESFAVAYEKSNRLIINLLTTSAFTNLVSKTYIKTHEFHSVDSKNKIYLFIDLNLPVSNEMSMVALGYSADTYGTLSLTKSNNIFGGEVEKNYLEKIGISTDEFLNCEAISPSILLHKYIDEGKEAEAIKLIEKERGNIDVNYEFNQRVPIFSAINNKMFNLFDAIINDDKFESNIEDGFGETLLESLLYLYGSDEVMCSKEDVEILERMIKSIISCKTFDFNATDVNNDTAINVACEYVNELWIVKMLAAKKNIMVNVINNFDCGVIANCIRNNNLEALKFIGKRPDLVVREEDKKLAKSFKINLNEYIKPENDFFEKYSYKEKVVETEDSLEYELTRA